MSHGIHLALDRDRAKALFGAREPETLAPLLRTYCDELAGSPQRFDSGDRWELLQLLLGGSLDEGQGEYPLNTAVLGGRPLDAGPGSMVRLIRPDSAAHIADALSGLDDAEMAVRWQAIDDAAPSDGDVRQEFEQSLRELAEFYRQAVADRSAVVFLSFAGEPFA